MNLREYYNAVRGYYKYYEEDSKNRSYLARAIAYQVYQLQFIFSKSKPREIDAFWPIDRKKIPRYTVRKKLYSKLPDKIEKPNKNTGSKGSN